ncbi:uncharacterized protein LOC144632752 isoform X2 [Oculina patagonica]
MLEVNMEDVLVHLKAVFEACDQNGDGFVKTQDLLRLGEEHGFQEMKTLIEKLDPEENGRIGFDGFCKGIHDFLGVNGDINLNDSGKEAHDLLLAEEDSYPRLTISVVENDQQEDSCCERDSTYSTTSTNEYNGDDDDNFQDELQTSNFNRNQKQYSTFPPPTGPRLKHRATLPAMNVEMYSDRCSHSDTSEYQSEEGFEGYGESFSEDTAFEESPTLRRERKFKEHLFRSPSSRRASAQAAAFSSHNMHLFKCHSENPSRNNSFDDLIGHDRALSDSEAGTSMFLLTELKRLSSQVSLLQEDHAMQTDKQHKIREENKLLCTRINALEEQIESQKLTTGQQVEEESLKHKLALTKLERENEESLEALNRKLLQAEEEIENLKKVEPLLRKELDTCQEEKRRLVKQVDSLELALQIKADEVAELKAKLEAEVKGRLEDQHHHEQEVALATEQMAELEKFKHEIEVKLKDHHNMEQQKTDLERHVQSLIKVLHSQTLVDEYKEGVITPREGTSI